MGDRRVIVPADPGPPSLSALERLATRDQRPSPSAPRAAEPPSTPAPVTAPAASSDRRTRWLRGDAVLLTPVLALAALTHGAGLYRSPGPLDGEGALVAQVWVSDHLADTAAAISPDGVPPLAWLQLTMWTELTGAFDRAPTAVGAGRELMVLVAVVSTALVWWVARRLPMPRWGAALAAACFALSPLAVEAHRIVSPENLATPWSLAAVGLLLGARRGWGAVVSSALCLAVAVLSSMTAVLLLPALGWLLWRTSPPALRRRTAAVWGGVFLAAGLLPALVLLLVRGPDLGGLDPTAAGPGSLGDVLRLDPVLPVLALVVLPLALLQRRLRPFVLAVVVPLVVLLGPALLTGSPAPTAALVVLVSPVVSLLVAGVARGLWRHRPSRLFGRDVRRPGGAALLVAAAAVLAVAASSWVGSLRALATDGADRPLAAATAWVGDNVPVPDRVVTDAAAWLELVEQGRARDVVVGFRTAAEPAALGDAWLVSTPSVRAAASSSDALADALAASRLVASFGEGDPRVEVRRTAPGPAGPGPSAPAPSPGPAATAAPTPSAEPTPDVTSGPSQPPVAPEPSPWATAAVLQLLSNPAIELGPQARLALRSGEVDDRLLSLLAVLAARHDLVVAELPRTDNEAAAGDLHHRILVIVVDESPVGTDSAAERDLMDLLEAQTGDFAVQTSVVQASGSVPPGLLIDLPPRKANP